LTLERGGVLPAGCHVALLDLPPFLRTSRYITVCGGMRVSIKCGPPPTDASEATEILPPAKFSARLRFIFHFSLAFSRHRKTSKRTPYLKARLIVGHHNSIMAVKQLYFTLFMPDASHQDKTTAELLWLQLQLFSAIHSSCSPELELLQ